MVTSNLSDKDVLYRIVLRLILEKVTKFGGFSSLTKKVINVEPPRGGPPPPPILEGLKPVQRFCFVIFPI